MKHFLLLAALLVTASSVAQIVNIPDPVFKQRLLNNSNINTNGDGEIQVSETEAFEVTLSLGTSFNNGIDDITGVEAFINITGIFGQNLEFTAADLSSNNNLEVISISNSALEELITPAGTLNLERLDLFL